MNTATKTSPVRRTLASLALGAFVFTSLVACVGGSPSYEGTYVSYGNGDTIILNDDNTGRIEASAGVKLPDYDIVWAIEETGPDMEELVLYPAGKDVYEARANITNLGDSDLFFEINGTRGVRIDTDFFEKQ